MMARVGRRDTLPEMIVRQLLTDLGYRYRLHRTDLPGTPDIAFVARRQAIFVHGCFWHRHPGCRMASTPKTRASFWAEKFRRNTERDMQVAAALEKTGWQFLIVWECETRDCDLLQSKLSQFLRA